MKSLYELTPAELGKLFPVRLEKFNPAWPAIFRDEKRVIQNLLSEKRCGEIAHFGSTAIPGIHAKPIIDMLVEIPGDATSRTQIIEIMQKAGYYHIPRNDSPPPYSMFVKGYTPRGFEGQVFHLHCAPKSHTGLWNRICFRDYLVNNPGTAKKYEALKLRLAREFRYDRDGYTAAKGDFVKKITRKALKESRNKNAGPSIF